MIKQIHIVLVLLILFGVNNLHAQTYTLDQFDKSTPLKINGGINTTHVFYSALDGQQRRDPYNYFISGNLNLRVFGYSLPFSFSFSNQDRSFRQPFNRIRVLPKYKWVRLHIGNSSMTFSPLTLSGHMFRGGGVELTPSEKFNFSAMYGTLVHAVDIDTTNPNNQPAYKRIGYGFKASTAKSRDKLALIFFAAQDQAESIAWVEGYQGPNPKENMVISLSGSKQLGKLLYVEAEWATSALTENSRVQENQQLDRNVFSFLGFDYRSSTAYYNAIKSSLNFKPAKYSLALAYERIAPEYQTLGAYFFNNDLENISLQTSTALLKQKMNLNLNVGLQRDNLDDAKLSSMRRFVGSLNMAYAVNAKLNLNAGYSSYQTFTRVRTDINDLNLFLPGEVFDEQDFTQIAQNANIGINYAVKNTEKKRNNLSINGTYQLASNEQAGQTQNAGSQFLNGNFMYTMGFVPQAMNLSLGVNANHNNVGTINTMGLGPTASINKALLENKLNTGLAVVLNNAFLNGSLTGQVFNTRWTTRYTLKEKHNFNFSLLFLGSQNKTTNQSIQELTGTFSYSYSF